MTPNRILTGLLAFQMSVSLAGLGILDAQGQTGPMLPASKITADNPLGLAIDHASISVLSLDKIAAFYQDVLGFKEIEHGSWGPDVKFRALAITGVFRVDLVQHSGSLRHTPVGKFDMEQGLLHLCFKTTDLKAALKQLTAKNATMRLTKDHDGNVTEIFLIDPEGNEVEIQGY